MSHANASKNPANPKNNAFHCIAPSKLILSGEHAVLYGCPALSMAIDLNTHCTLSHQPADSDNQHIDHTARFTLTLTDFKLEQTFTFADWQTHAQQIEHRFQAFKKEALAVDKVLTSPFDLVLICLWVFDQHHSIHIADWKIKIHSDVPIGRGLGSSAGVIVTLLAGLFKSHHVSVTKQSLLSLSKQVESYQHGTSSGLDPATLIYAGLLKYQMGQPIQTLPTQTHSAWLIDTGAPASHTGACVQAVKQTHQHNTPLWQDFKKTSFEIEQAWLNSDSKHHPEQLKQAIHQNHRLLCKIGVVPEKVQMVIKQLNLTLNAACKICGAGSVVGDQAGMVLCVSEQSPLEICQQYGYSVWPLTLQTQGVRCELD